MSLIYFDLEPIEQNVQSIGVKGMYELTLIEQMSRSLERFKHDAEKYAQIIKDKPAPDVERLVSYTHIFTCSGSSGNLYKTVHPSMEAMCQGPCLTQASHGISTRSSHSSSKLFND